MVCPDPKNGVGMLGQRIVIPAKRLLPQRVFEAVLARVLSL